MRTRAFVLTGVALLAFSAAHARINHLEPWSPGYDAGVPDRALSHALNVFIGNDAQGVDATEFAYTLTTPVRGNWELGGGVSYLSYDAQGASESGLADLKLGAKRSLDQGLFARVLERFLGGRPDASDRRRRQGPGRRRVWGFRRRGFELPD
ncbi:MAG: hypothetical protein IPP09_04990 [Elusimicrobia bacterium]|nr:hypothetical protein [Elusimicrobiota bacterium]